MDQSFNFNMPHIETSSRLQSPLLSSYPWTTGALSREDIRTIVDSNDDMAVSLIMKECACF